MMAVAVKGLEGLGARVRDITRPSPSASPVGSSPEGTSPVAPVPAVVRVARADAGQLPPLVPVARVAAPTAPPLRPIVAQGATHLRDSVVAIRRGDSVTVHFDIARVRTRRPDKFERIVRSTLPAVYGPIADSVLMRIPSGELTRAGDLLTDLPVRGLRFALGGGWALALWPATRPGQDGPLVVRYRAVVVRQ